MYTKPDYRLCQKSSKQYEICSVGLQAITYKVKNIPRK